MATDQSGKILASLYDGLANLVGSAANSLTSVVIGIIQELARIKTRFSGTAPLIDSSGGTAGANVGTVTIPPVADTSSSGGATVASVNTALDTVMAAYATLAERCNIGRAMCGMGSSPTGPEAAGGGTIAAVTVTVSAASGDSSASQATVALAFADVLTRQRTTARNIDEVRKARGLAAMTYASVQGTSPADTLAMAAITNAAAVAADAAATTGVAASTINTALSVLRNNIAYMADKLDEALVAPPRRERAAFAISATEYDAGTSVWAISPCNGRIRAAHSVVQATTTGAGAITFELATVAVVGMSITVATGSSAGDVDSSAEIGDIATGLVTKGQAIEIVSDGTPTGGAVSGFIEIEPTAIDAAMAVYAGI